MTDPLSIRLIRKSIPVLMETPEGEVTYTIQEMTGFERDQYLMASKSRWERDKDGKPTGSVDDLLNLQASLIATSLYDATGKKVPVEAVSKFPVAAQDALYAACQEINGLGAVLPKKP